MKNYIPKPVVVCLLSILWLSAAAASLSGAQRLTEIDSVKAELKRTITVLEEHVALSRSMGEFVAEIGLFDNRVYGRVSQKRTQQADEINTLNSQIEDKNSVLETAVGDLESIKAMEEERGEDNFGIEGREQTNVAQEYELMVKQLEEEIADLQLELNSLLVPLEAGTELLDGSLLLNDILPPMEMLDEQSAELLLEQQRRLLEELEREEQKILKQRKPSPGAIPKEIKKK
jgi:hypothetical protein